MTPGPPRILIVEDDDLLRDALAVTMVDEGFEVAVLEDGAGCESLFDRFRPDLAVLDVRLPGPLSGLDLARMLRGKSDLPILFLTAADDVEDRLAGFDAGGDDYLTKPFAVPELLARVKALLRRSDRLSSSVRQVDDLVIDEGARSVRRADVPIALTKTEFDLLLTLAKRPGQVFPKDRLLALVWGYELYDPNVVEVHVSALRRKLEAHGPRIVHTVRGVGYVLRV
jgi:two-component system, OmpR family, response regulator